MNRKKFPSHRVPCQRQNCCGMINEQQEHFLSVTSRGATNSHSKKKAKANKKKQKNKSLLQQSYHQISQQNKQLHRKLSAKKKKIEELQLKLHDQEQQINKLRQHQKKRRTSKIQNRQRKTSSDKKQIKMVQQSQVLAKQTFEKYKKLQQDFSKYRQNAEKKIDKLRSQKQNLMTEGAQKAYSRQIDQLKSELQKFKQDQMTVSSVKNLHHAATNEQKLKFQISGLKLNISTLKNEVNQLKSYNKELQQQLKERTIMAQHKESELRSNLDAINIKINSWEKQYNDLRYQSANWEQSYNNLLHKYQNKKRKYRINNEQWAQIFKQFLRQIDKLKQQLDIVSARNVKLIKMYGTIE